MLFITGDIHGSQKIWRDGILKIIKPGDTIIIVGDFGKGFYSNDNQDEESFLDFLDRQNITILFIDGNHENFSQLNNHEISNWNGGKVHFIRSHIIHLIRGEIYSVEGKNIFVMGGGYTSDRSRRRLNESWWHEEMPNDEEYRNASENLKKHGYKVDYILTHTAPANTVEYMKHLNLKIKNSAFDEAPLTGFLQWIEESVDYHKWYFGHFHIDKELWRNQYVLYQAVREFFTGDLIEFRNGNL